MSGLLTALVLVSWAVAAVACVLSGQVQALCLVSGTVGEEGRQEQGQVSDPCLHYKCEEGSECVMVVNDLLQLPVAHCVQQATQQEPAGNDGGVEGLGCSSREVGVSVVSCRTHQQWLAWASFSCSGYPSVQVRHPCHRRNSASPSIFLQATLSCCHVNTDYSEAPPTATTVATEMSPTTADPSLESTDQLKETEPPSEEEEEEEETGYGVVVITMITLGSLVAATLVAMAAIKFFRHKRRLANGKPRLSFVTSYVNPSYLTLTSEPSMMMTDPGTGKPDSSYVVANGNCSTECD